MWHTQLRRKHLLLLLVGSYSGRRASSRYAQLQLAKLGKERVLGRVLQRLDAVLQKVQVELEWETYEKGLDCN